MPQKPLVLLAILLASSFLGGFIYFKRLIPKKSPASTKISTDAIVVLTGGNNRIETGIKLLEANPSKILFITGIEKTKRLKFMPESLKPRVERGSLATTTRENASETKAWIEANKITSITLVTANYHMPRSMLEFKHAMPSITIESYPAFTPGFKLNKWCKHGKTLKLLCTEYIKFAFINAQYFLIKIFEI